MSNWDLLAEFFVDGIPFAEYVWIPIIVGISFAALYIAKKMVADV
jgi:hypothetical protein